MTISATASTPNRSRPRRTGCGNCWADFFANVREVDAAGKCDNALSKQLRGFAQLRKLGLLNCPITNAAMENIEGLTQLQVLDLRETKITDAGLKHLEGLSQLQKLYLFDDSITERRDGEPGKAVPT